MDRFALAGLALAAVALPALAAPPPPPPPLADDAPQEVDGYSASAMYGDFVRWLQDEADAAISERHAAEIAALESPGYLQFLDLRIHADWYYRDVASILERLCTSRPDAYTIQRIGYTGMSDEEIAEHCHWQLRLIDGPDSEALALSYQGAAFDPARAAAHLNALGIGPDETLYDRGIDWSGYQSAEAFRTDTIRVRTWTSRTCDAFSGALERMETLDPGPLDVPGFGETAEQAHAMPHSARLTATVYTTSGGNDATLTFDGTAGMARALVNQLDAIVGPCEPDQ